MPDPSHDQAAALPLPFPAHLARALRIPRRHFKLGITGSILFAGIFGIVSENKYISTSDAVISSYTLDVRTPIEGTITGLPIASGVYVHQGELLGQMDNPRVDRQHLDNLLTVEDAARSTADAITIEQLNLSRQRQALVDRSDAHISAVADRLRISVAESERLLDAKKLALQEANIELERGRKLHDAGIMAAADYDKLASIQQIADQEFAAQQEDLNVARAEVRAAEKGLLTEPGTNSDVSYSRQRADELAIKMAENARLLLASQAQASQSQSAVQTESTRAALMRHTELRSPIDGLIWRFNTVNSEHAAAGDSILSMVDCGRQFIIAEIPQDRTPDVALHQSARFRLAGESKERTGSVLSVSGEARYGSDAKFAAFPKTNPDQGVSSVIIAIDTSSNALPPDAESCLVGRSVRVLIPTAPSNLASRWIRDHF